LRFVKSLDKYLDPSAKSRHTDQNVESGQRDIFNEIADFLSGSLDVFWKGMTLFIDDLQWME